MRFIAFTGPRGSGKDTAYELLKEAKKVDGKLSFAGPLKQVCSEVFGLAPVLLNDAVLKERALETPIRLTAKHIRQIRDLCEEYVNPVTPDGKVLYRSNAISVIGLEGREFKTPRELLQIIGTELIRDRVWKDWHKVAAFSDKILNATRKDGENRRRVYKENGIYAITDLRFVDELEFLRTRFGEARFQAYYVFRPEAEAKLEESVASGKAHPSETQTQILKTKVSGMIKNDGSIEDLTETLKGVEFPEASAQATTKGSRFRYAAKGSDQVVDGAPGKDE